MSERRYDPTSGEWVVFATHRQDRIYHPDAAACPLDPTRPGQPPTEIPRASFEIVVFDNRFPALSPDPPAPSVRGTPLTPVAASLGRCEVVVYSDVHDTSLSRVGTERIRLLVEVWAARTSDLGSEPGIGYVMPFENRGEVIGVTLSHPHGQIYGYPEVPPRPRQELETARRHLERHGTCVWCDVVAQEEIEGTRVVFGGRHFLACVPFWARWPYQVEIWSRRHAPDLPALSPDERQDLAEVLEAVVTGYDALFGFDLAYILLVHQRPTGPGDWDAVSHLHLEIDPPNRTADKLKFLAGSETGARTYITDVAPEDSAAALRAAVARGAAARSRVVAGAGGGS